MRTYLIIIFLGLLNPIVGHSAPAKLEVIFLSQSRMSGVLNLLDRKAKGVILSRLMAQNKGPRFDDEYVIDFSHPEGFESASPIENADCVSMGDGCFNPQLGYVENIPGTMKFKKKKTPSKKEKNPFKLATFNSADVDLVECEEGRYFDIFCGKASRTPKAKLRPAKLEIWIDTSSSMKNVDYTTKDNYCERRFFAAKIKKECKDEVHFSVFDTARNSLGSYDNLCHYAGSNNGKRTVKWIEANSADHLVLITDVDEYHGALREYLEKTNATIVGIGRKIVISKDLKGLVPNLIKSCN